MINNFNYRFFDTYTEKGIVNEFNIYLKNLNSVGKNSLLYKNSPQSEIMSVYSYGASFPLIKKNIKSTSTFEPKLLFQFSPHQMKNHAKASSRLSMSNIYTVTRMGVRDSFEQGKSVALGFDYKIEKDQVAEKNNFIDGKITEKKEYIDFKIASVLRLKEEEKISKSSTLNKKISNIIGKNLVIYTLSILILAMNFLWTMI